MKREADGKEELRRGLQHLQDTQLVSLRDQLDAASSQRQQTIEAIAALRAALKRKDATLDALTAPLPTFEVADSPIEAAIFETKASIRRVREAVSFSKTSLGTELQASVQKLESETASIEAAYGDFVKEFEKKCQALSPEQRRMLDSHREVFEKTRNLGSLRQQMAHAKDEVEKLLSDLVEACEQVVQIQKSRSALRKGKIDLFSQGLAKAGVQLGFSPMASGDEFDQAQSSHRSGWEIVQQIRTSGATGSFHARLGEQYAQLKADLLNGSKLIFASPDLSVFVTRWENDDMSILFDPDGAGSGYRPIDQLSAGQRCTAMFPILLKLRSGPLVIDQPEDNLDNRHIAALVAPELLAEKHRRQIILTSHNANLVVLSDAENIVVFEGAAGQGAIVEQGFSASRGSPVTRHILDILDGGETALEMRYRKYGRLSEGSRRPGRTAA